MYLVTETPGQAPDDKYLVHNFTSVEPPAADPLFTRDDGHVVFPRGQRIILFGDPGGGKSWIALMAAHEVVMAGGLVIWLDWESPPWRTAARAWVLDLIPTIESTGLFRFYLADLFTKNEDAMEYVCLRITAFVEAGLPALVVVDSASAAGIPRDSGDAMDQRWNVLVGQWARAKATAVIIDHQPKGGDTRGRGPVGSGDKLAQADIGFVVSGTCWTPTADGSITMTVSKDRDGLVGAKGERIATIAGTWDRALNVPRFRWAVSEAGVDEKEDAIVEYLREHGPKSGNEIFKDLVTNGALKGSKSAYTGGDGILSAMSLRKLITKPGGGGWIVNE